MIKTKRKIIDNLTKQKKCRFNLIPHPLYITAIKVLTFKIYNKPDKNKILKK